MGGVEGAGIVGMDGGNESKEGTQHREGGGGSEGGLVGLLVREMGSFQDIIRDELEGGGGTHDDAMPVRGGRAVDTYAVHIGER